MTGPNPYNYNLPAPPEMFFGRQKDVEKLERCVLGPHGDSVALIGGRRMGKTSLLEALARQLEPEQYCDGFIHVPITISIAGEGIESPDKLFQIAATQLDDWLSQRTSLSSMPRSPSVPLGGPLGPIFRRYLEIRNREVKDQLGCSIRLIILMDECEDFEQQPWTPGLYEALRWLLTQPTTRGLFKVVMAGSYRFLSNATQKTSPLRNVLKPHYLHVLDPQSAGDLAVKPSDLSPSNPIVAAVILYSGGHPFLTQYLMHELWEFGLVTSRVETVARLALRFPEERSDFFDWAETLGEPAMSAYAVLTEANEALTKDQIRAKLPATSPSLPQAIEALCYHGLVAQDSENGRHQVVGKMFQDWFVSNVGTPALLSKRPGRITDAGRLPPQIVINLAEGDVVLGDSPTKVDQRGQMVEGAQTNVGGDANGPLISGQFEDVVELHADTAKQQPMARKD